MAFLIYVEWRMMEKSRLQSQITKVSGADRDKYGAMIASTNLYSLGVIITTLIVIVVLCLILYNFN